MSKGLRALIKNASILDELIATGVKYDHGFGHKISRNYDRIAKKVNRTALNPASEYLSKKLPFSVPMKLPTSKTAGWKGKLFGGAVAATTLGGALGMRDAYSNIKKEGDSLREEATKFKRDIPKHLLTATGGAMAGTALTNMLTGNIGSSLAPKPAPGGAPQGGLDLSKIMGMFNNPKTSALDKYLLSNYIQREQIKQAGLGKILGIGGTILGAGTLGRYGTKYAVENSGDFGSGIEEVKDGTAKLKMINDWAPVASAVGGAVIGGVGTSIYNSGKVKHA